MMGVRRHPFFMFKRILLSPVTHFNILLVGFFILVGVIHNHAHHNMEVDVHSYVKQFCSKNPDTCQGFLENEY